MTAAETAPGERRLQGMRERLNADARLVERGRLVTGDVLLRIGDQEHLLRFREGRLASIAHGPFVMASATFSLGASEADWALYWRPVPPPGSNDLLALKKRRALRIEGDLRLFMANLFYFKAVFALPRAETPA